ncbi:hypothetical protein NVP1101O_153 [Vibrio phage 1.101.O._10N.261.45.C6]|nr:hypothetical protein NVP1101O_153 [Vibrio phage 1.101.O._10N.261.45.C6]
MKIERENWKRSYRITIGTPDIITVAPYVFNGTVTKGATPTQQLIDQRTIPSNARILSNLPEDNEPPRGFSFSLESIRRLQDGKDANPERTTLKLYNLDEDMENVINQKGCKVFIELGYGGKVSDAYFGDVVDVIVDRRSGDAVYTISCIDGGVDLRNTRLNADYEESMSDKDIIVDMVSRFPSTALGSYGLDDASGRYTVGGESFAGRLLTNFDLMMARNNLQYARFNGKMVIVPYRLKEGSGDYNKFLKTNYELTDDLILSAKKVSDKGKLLIGSEKSNRSPITLSTFYLPIGLGDFFTVGGDSKVKLHGTYQTNSVKISAHSHGQNWYSILRGDPV